MPGTNINGSPNIALLDSKIVADLCGGAFYVDLTTSVWIGSGYNNVEGADVKITNPYGVIIKNYPTSGFDIYPPMTGIVGINVPTQAGNFQYGTYTVEVRLTDSGGTEYIVSKPVNLCQPNVNNKTRNYGSLSSQLNGICSEGKMYVIVDTPPNYKGNVVHSQVNSFTLEYPTSSGIDELDTDVASFSTYLFEGVYKITGTICALYDNGDNVFFKVNYRVKRKKEVFCSIDDCCVSAKFEELNLLLDSDCSQEEKDRTSSIIVDGLFYLKAAELAAKCGVDPSDYISKLEVVLGCKCTCNCSDGTPIINNNPSKDFNITGCNVIKTTVGLTDSYLINNYAYTTTVDPNGGVLTASAQTLSSCTKTQALSFNINIAYNQIKNLGNANVTEANFWASIINKSINSIDATCLGYNSASWATLSFAQKWSAVVAFACSCCSCVAAVTSSSISKEGADAILTWVATGTFSYDIYVDGVLFGNVLGSHDTVTLTGMADGLEHMYVIIPKCSNGKIGTTSTGTFTLLACAHIEPPSVSSNNVNGVDCPYDLTALVASLPSGITAEWHTANNTHSSSLLGDPTMVNSGVYYVFAKDDEGCYSIGIGVTVICSSESNCTAPQTLLVTTITGGNLVQFQSAAFPPPLNSYTVKRKPGASPDVPGSYTTIGTPSFNATSGRWEILDNSAANNVLYTYKAQSNCGDSTTPYVLYNYSNITCPSITITPGTDDIQYSFVGVGGYVDKYEVKLYDESGITLLHTDTHIPSFPNPITGTFMYLTSATIYHIFVRVFIGAYYKDCAVIITETDAIAGTSGSYILGNDTGTICAGYITTLYTDGPFAMGGILYVDGSLTTPVTGYIYVLDVLTSRIFNLNTSTGVIGSDTTLTCSPTTSVLTFYNYSAADFDFELSTPMPTTNIVITGASVHGFIPGDCTGGISEIDTINVGNPLTILAGNTGGLVTGNSPMSCSINSWKRVNNIIINGVNKTNGDIIVIDGIFITIIINTSCNGSYAC